MNQAERLVPGLTPRVAGQAAGALCLVATLFVAGCAPPGRGGDAGEGGGAVASPAPTFVKSFGGPGFDRGGSVGVDGDGQLTVSGSFNDDAVGGSIDRPWLLGLDLIGDTRWEVSPGPTIGVRSASYTFAAALDDGGALFGGENDNDVFLQRVGADGTEQWTVALDGGPWPDLSFGAGRSRSEETLRQVEGNGVSGWYVVSRSTADLIDPATGWDVRGATSIVVWFVEPDGEVRWQRRLSVAMPSSLGPTILRAPKFVAATLRWDGRLAMVVEHLDGFDEDMRLLVFDNGGGLQEAAADFGSILSPSIGETILFQTSDPVAGVIDPVRDDGYLLASSAVVKLDRDGNESWRLPANGSVAALAQTFPDASPTWLWAGLQSNSRSPNASMLRISIDGSVQLRCEFPPGERLLWLRAVDGGRHLSVLLQLSGSETAGLLREVVLDDDCSELRQRVLPALPVMAGAANDVRRASSIDAAGNVVVPWVSVDDAAPGRVYRIDDGGEVSALEAPTDAGNRWHGPMQMSVGPDGGIVLVLNRQEGGDITTGDFPTEAPPHVYHLDSFGRVERAWEPELSGPDGYSPGPVRGGDGTTWIAVPGYCGSNLLTVESDGSVLNHRLSRRLEFSRLRPAGEGVEGVATDCVVDGPFERVLLTLRTQGATVRSLPEDLLQRTGRIGRLRLLDVEGGRRLFQYSPDIDSATRLVLLDGAQGGWEVSLPQELGEQEGSEVRLVDAVLAPDGGVAALLQIRAFRFDAIADPETSFGDQDLGLLKLTAEGQLQWLRVYGAAGDELGSDLERLPSGYAIVATSDSFDAVTPGTDEIWVVRTGLDGRVAADARGNEFCQACLGSVSGQALLDLLPVERLEVGPLGEEQPVTMETIPQPVSELPLAASDLSSINTARQCSGDATDVQEAPIDPPPEEPPPEEPPEEPPPPAETATLLVIVSTDGLVATPGMPAGGTVTSSPAGIQCADAGSDCAEGYPLGTAVTLTATPRAGHEFLRWDSGRSGDGCDADAGATTVVIVDRTFECQASFRSSTGPTQAVTVLFDGQPGRVVDVATGTLDCTAACTVELPVADSPIQLRALEETFSFGTWANCTAEVPDPANPGGPPLCAVDISTPPPSIIVEFL